MMTASLMIFGWILCASVASVIGRYFQPYWWGEKMFGSKVWVKVHWLFVLLTTAAVIAGFTIIFVGVDGISQLYEVPNITLQLTFVNNKDRNFVINVEPPSFKPMHINCAYTSIVYTISYII